MKILAFWDIYWRIGRTWLKIELPKLIKQYSPDFIIANADNLTSWRGPIEKHLLELEKMWIDIITSWDHIFDNFIKIEDYLAKSDSKLLRCANYYDSWMTWTWEKIFEKNWKKLLAIHLQWEVFMNHKVANPFLCADQIIKKYNTSDYDGVVIDFHKEVTAEAYWLANYLDWKTSFIYWTHTHIQTNDEQILPNGTWFICDVWMNWSLNSVIWAEFESVRSRFIKGINKWKIKQSLDPNYLVSGAFVEIWEDKKCVKIEKIRLTWKVN